MQSITNQDTNGKKRIVLGNTGLPDGGWEQVKRHWTQPAGEPWLIGDLYPALARRFVRSVTIEHPESFDEATGRSGVLYLANHQNLLESLFFTTVMSAITERRIGTMIKIWIREHWIGRMLEGATRYPEFAPGALFPYQLFYFNDAEPRSIFRLLYDMRNFMLLGGSCMVHVEGTRAFSSKHRVTKISDSVIRLAADAGVPIIPVRFSGGLPAEEVERKPIYPYRLVAQDIHLGEAIKPEALADLPMKDRKQYVLDAINGTGPDPDSERLNQIDPEFESAVQSWSKEAGCPEEFAVLYQALRGLAADERSKDTQDLLNGRGTSEWPDTPKGQWMEEWVGRLLGSQGSQLLARGRRKG